MIELTEHQVRVLTDLSNGKRNLASYASTHEDTPEAAKIIDGHFAEQMLLVTYGLVTDITERPGFKKLADQYREEEGRLLRVLTITETSRIMFKRQRKTVN